MTKAVDLAKTGSLVNSSGQIDLTTGVTSTLPVANGGTGATTQAGAAAAVLPTQAGNSGKYLTTDGANSSWATVTQTTFSAGTTGFTPNTATSGTVTLAGTLNVANGGTGATTLSANAVLLGNGTSALQSVAPSTSGNILTSNGTTWVSQAPSGGGVTSLNGQTGAITNTNLDSIGSYAVLYNATNSDLGINGTRAGSGLRYNASGSYTTSSFQGTFYKSTFATNVFTGNSTWADAGGTALSGTWRKLSTESVYGGGPYGKGTAYKFSQALWVRIS